MLGVDGSDWSRHHYISREEYLQADLARNALSLSNSYNVAIFVQVVEHLPIECSLAIIDEISSATMEAIVFSAAQPGQFGISHITLREPEFWLARFRQNGWEPDVAGTISLRMLSTLHSFRRNLFLFVRKEKADTTRLGELIEFGAPGERAGNWKWPEHRVGETIIGFPGQRWSFNMSGDREVPPLSCGRGAKLQRQVQLAESELKSAHLKELALQRQVQLAEATLKSTLIAIEASSSWKITEPLRRLAEILRREAFHVRLTQYSSPQRFAVKLYAVTRHPFNSRKRKKFRKRACAP